jgi:hypothetical protein
VAASETDGYERIILKWILRIQIGSRSYPGAGFGTIGENLQT